ncbi:MAG: M28 family peptidase [Gemmatimonadetes bacterium]|nr:M28 family peptidase [Gemmatimonadota bacterium]
MSPISTFTARSAILTAAIAAFVVPSAGACAKGGDAQAASGGRATSEFNADSAMSYVKQQVAFGPRVPGTPGWQKTGDWIVALLKANGATVTEQKWTHTLADKKQIPMRNIFARFKPEATERILYVTHWDTRPHADSDPAAENRSTPIPGANDGASGVALLLGVADALKKAPATFGVDLLFVDGEDYGTFGPDVDVLIGATYFAANLPSPGYKPLFGVLWDMIGDADLQLPQEMYSAQNAPEVVQRVWSTAKELGYEQYFKPDMRSYPITDDHYPLLKAGLRVVDVIDLDYDAHHTLADDIGRVSAKSLKIVGDVAMALLR